MRNIEDIKKDLTNTKTADQLIKLEEFWQQQEKEHTGKLEAARHQLFELEKDKMSFAETMDYLFESVLKQRGINMLYAVAAFLITFLVFHLLRLLILKLNPLRRFPQLIFLGNLIDVLLYFLSFIAATAAMMIVLYVYGNWLVLGVIVIVLLGLVWAAKNTLPMFVDQIKVLLGLGSVRQGEKVIYEGIPYKIASIGIYSYLNNPLLTGGILRLPLKDLLGMRSRPYDESEPWFPCKEGDYILINGKIWRHVILQTPQIVKFEWYEMHETMPTSTFMSQNVFSISQAPFWVGFGFELAYQHRREMDDICQKLTAITEEELQKAAFADLVIEPWIDFENFGDSSLILTYWVQMKKEAAASYPAVKRALRKIALKAANKYDLEIIQLEHKIDHKVDDMIQVKSESEKGLPDIMQEG